MNRKQLSMAVIAGCFAALALSACAHKEKTVIAAQPTQPGYQQKSAATAYPAAAPTPTYRQKQYLK